MKTTKRILAVVLAAMMLALMIPFAAGAVTNFTAEITAKEGYTVTLYKIGEFNGTDKYTAVSGVATGLKTAIEAEPAVPQTIYEAAEAAKKAGQNTGTTVGSQTAGNTGKVTFTTTEAGLYYATVTGTPANVNVKKTGGSIFYLSTEKDSTGRVMTSASVDISGKIEDGTVNVDKEIVGSDMSSTTQTTAKVGEEVTFKLTASVTGTKDEYLKKYEIKDTMSEALTYKRVNYVKVDTTTLTVDDDYKVTAAGQNVTIALTNDYLDAARAETDNGFYSAATVTVELVCELNNKAVIGRVANDDKTEYSNTVANYNKDSLTYTNKYDDVNEKEGKTVHVYSFSLDVYKVDANNKQTKLDGAKFLLTGPNGYRNADGVTANGGKLTYTGLKMGTYTLKETEAPAGYNLNTTEYTVVIKADGTVESVAFDQTLKGVVVGDTQVIVPATGGPGTVMFTVIGASLIACAGVLFVILKKKRSAK